MNTYTLQVNKEDFAYIIAAIGQRAEILQGALMIQAQGNEEHARRQADEARRAALPDPLAQTEQPIKVDKVETSPTPALPSLKQRRAALMRILKSKEAHELTTAEIARRAGVSYVTAAKARNLVAPKKGRK